MLNLKLSAQSGRTGSVEQDVNKIKDGPNGLGSQQWNTDADIEDRSPIAQQNPLKLSKKIVDFSNPLENMWTKIFGAKVPPRLEKPEEHSSAPAIRDMYSPVNVGTPTNFISERALESTPAAAVQPQAEVLPEAATEKTGKPVDGENRPSSDTRTADQIIDDNPVLKNLGNQKDIQRDKLKERCGDWTADNPDPKSRADAAWKLAHVLNWIDNSKDSKGNPIDGQAGNGDITGLTKDGDARHGTKAGLLKDFGDQGYPAIKANQQLDVTKDSHVRPDGTNKDNFQWFIGKVGNVIKYIFPALGNVMVGMGDSKGGFGGMIKGAFEGYAHNLKNMAVGIKDALLKGKISPMQIVASMYRANTVDGLKKDGQEKVGQVLDNLPI